LGEFFLRFQSNQRENDVGFRSFLILSEMVVGGFGMWQLRRERIAERMKALQELVPNANKVQTNKKDLN
jgi:hypothetical protein